MEIMRNNVNPQQIITVYNYVYIVAEREYKDLKKK